MTKAPGDRDLVTSLASTVCPACGGRKQAKQTFCGRDYYLLPTAARSRLFRGLVAGYAEAVVAAMDLLGKSEFRLASPQPARLKAGEQLTMFTPGPREGINR